MPIKRLSDALLLALVVIGTMLPAELAGQPTPPERPAAAAKVLLLGTFHFKDAGLDDFKPLHEVDIFSEQRQAEIEQVVRCLDAYRPTVVGVEATAESRERLDSRYAAYRAGSFELPANEIYQLGFRVAAAQDLEAVEPIDAKGRWYEPYIDPEEWAVEHGQAEALIASETPWEEFYEATYSYEDARKMRQTLREFFVETNQEANLLESHGHYLLGSFKAGLGDEYPGADGKTAWYNRNLRIFANILRTIESPDERVLVVIGAGHVPIIRHAIQASPQVELVEVEQYLGAACGE